MESPAAATRAVGNAKAGPLYSNPAFIISDSVVYSGLRSQLSPLSLVSLGTVVWDDNVRMLTVGVSSGNVISGAMGYWLGSSFGTPTQRKRFTEQ